MAKRLLLTRGSISLWSLPAALLVASAINFFLADWGGHPLIRLQPSTRQFWQVMGYDFYVGIRTLYPGRRLIVTAPDDISVLHLRRLTGNPVQVAPMPTGVDVSIGSLIGEPHVETVYRPRVYVPVQLRTTMVGSVRPAILVQPGVGTGDVLLGVSDGRVFAFPVAQ